jgi:nucleotide-binding universal stress UspA family protein
MSLTINRILVPVDFSDSAMAAIDHAAGLASANGASVDMLHCYPASMAAMPPYGPPLPEITHQALRDAAQARISAARDRLREAGVEVRAHISADVPSRAIVEAAKELEADLIVMGTKGLGGIRHVLLGSVAERTVRAAHCPVITVPVRDADG